jgi:hypothetical protein
MLVIKIVSVKFGVPAQMREALAHNPRQLAQLRFCPAN